MKKILLILILISPCSLFAEDKIELKTTVIKGNTELPKILYVVPWQDTKQEKAREQRLVLHSLFGDLFDPVRPLSPKEFSNIETHVLDDKIEN